MNDLEGKRLLITSGPTRGPIDAVRYITNKSTGRLGMLLAGEALSRGAMVTFVYGKGSRVPDIEQMGADALSRLRLREIETVDELLAVIEQKARASSLSQVFVLTTQTTHWFRERGFELISVQDLPMAKRDLYNYRRNSKVLAKRI